MQTKLSDVLLQRPAKSKAYLGHVFPWVKKDLIIKIRRHTGEKKNQQYYSPCTSYSEINEFIK